MPKRKRSNLSSDGRGEIAPLAKNKGISPNKKKLKTAAAQDPYFKKRKNPNAKI